MAYSAGAAYVQVLPSLRGFNRTVQTELARQGSGLGAQIGAQIGTGMTKGVAPALSGIGKLTGDLGAGVGRLTGTVGAQVGRMVGTVGVGLGQMADSSERVMSRVGGSVRRGLVLPLTGARDLLASYGLTASSAFAIAGAFALTAGVKFAAFTEQATTAFTTMLGSGQAAQQFLRELSAFAARTPFELPQVTAAAQRLMAFGFAAKDVIPTLTAIGDAVAGLGGSAEQVDQVTNAIGQMMAKGKIQSDEILQLTEAGIPALRLLANQYGVTTARMQEMITEGAVPAAEAIPRLLTGIEQGTNGAAGATTRFAGMMAEQSKTLTGMWSTFVDNFNAAMGQLVTPAMPAIKAGLGFLSGAVGALPGLFAAAARSVQTSGLPTFLNAIGVAARIVWDALRPVVVLFGQVAGAAIITAWRLLGDILANYIGPALVGIAHIVEPLTPLIVAAAAGFAAWYGVGTAISLVRNGLMLLGGTVTLVTKGIQLLRLGMFALQLAFAVNPVGVLITALAALAAGVAYAWTHFAGFRDVVLTVWRAIQAAALWVWNSGLKPTFSAVVTAVRATGSAFSWLWVTVISPVFKAIYTAAAILAGIVVTVLVAPVLLALKALGALVTWLWSVAVGPAFRAIGSAATWLWQNALQPALSGIGALISWLYSTFVAPVFAAIAATVRAAGVVALWLWRNAFLPALRGIGTALSVVYNSVLLPVFNAIGAAVRAVGAAFQFVYASLIRPAWEGMGRAVRAVYDNGLRPAFEAIKTAVRAVGDAFSAVVEAIRIVWNKIKSIAAAPINFVITTIWNNGIRKAWNAIVGWIPGLDLTLGELSPIKAANGAVLPGYAPGRDTVPALLSPGEAVLVPEAVRMLGAKNILALNKMARGTGRTGPTFGPDGTPRFFLGGIWDGIKSVAGGIAHVASSVAGAVADAASFVASFTSDPLGTLTSMVPGLDGLAKWASKGWGRAITKLPGSIFGGLISTIKRALGLEDDGKGSPASGGIAAAQTFAQQQRGKTYLWGATGPEHWDCSGLVGALVAVTQGKDPYRRYMTTAQMGPGKFGMKSGKGVFTVYLGPGHTAANLGGLHAEAYGGDGTPLAIGRVGTPLSYYTQTMHLFARGGLVGANNPRRRWESFWENGWPEPPTTSPAMLYDSGGWVPPGVTQVYNHTGRPEALLNAGQWDAISAAARSDGGEFTGTLVLDSGELLGVVRGEITRANERTGLAVARRTR